MGMFVDPLASAPSTEAGKRWQTEWPSASPQGVVVTSDQPTGCPEPTRLDVQDLQVTDIQARTDSPILLDSGSRRT